MGVEAGDQIGSPRKEKRKKGEPSIPQEKTRDTQQKSKEPGNVLAQWGTTRTQVLKGRVRQRTDSEGGGEKSPLVIGENKLLGGKRVGYEHHPKRPCGKKAKLGKN